METLNANNNTIEILIMVFGGIFLVLWLVWVFRLILANRRMKGKNRRLLAMVERLDKAAEKEQESDELLRTQAEKIAELEAAISPNAGAEAVVEAPAKSDKQLWKEFTEAVKDRKIHLREKVSKDELAELVGGDKKVLSSLAAAMLPQGQTLMDWLDGLRLRAAIPLIRHHNARKTGEDEEETMDDVAKKAGFSGARSMGKAAKLHLGMSLAELSKIV